MDKDETVIDPALKTLLEDTILKGVTEYMGTKGAEMQEERIKTILDEAIKGKKFPGFGDRSEEAKSRKYKCMEFFKALSKKDPVYLANLKTMSEDTDSAGGFLVPEEVKAELDRIVEDFGLIRKLSRKIPMSRDTLNMPTLGTAPTVTWPGEGNTGTDGSPVFSNVKMNAKTAIGLSPVTNELLADANLAVVDMLLELFGEALAGAEDEQGFNGVGSPFVGLLNHADITTVTMTTGKDTFAEATLDDYRDLISQIKPTALPGSAYVMHKATFALVQKITENSQHVSSFQNPLVSGKPEGGMLVPAGFLWGYPVYTSEKIVSTTAVSTKFAVFGNFKHFYFGDRQEMAMDISKEATVGSVNAFASNHSIVRVLERVALAVGIPTAFAVLKTAAS